MSNTKQPTKKFGADRNWDVIGSKPFASSRTPKPKKKKETNNG